MATTHRDRDPHSPALCQRDPRGVIGTVDQDESRLSLTAPSDHSDSTLITALRQGDKSAFETIYRKYARDLFNYARRNIAEKEDCAELIQDLFESLWARRENLTIRFTLRGYLMGMVRYKIIEYFRKNRLHKKYAQHFLLFEAVYEEAPDHDCPSQQSVLDKLIAELPDRCSQALRLRLSENLSNQEIARRMNIGTRTVETYMFRAFNYIRSHYRQARE